MDTFFIIKLTFSQIPQLCYYFSTLEKSFAFLKKNNIFLIFIFFYENKK